MKKLGYYWEVVMSGGHSGKNTYGKIPIYGMRLNFKLDMIQVLVKSFDDFAWINVDKNMVDLDA